MKKGDKLKVFPDTDIDAYINYFDSIGLRSNLDNGYIIITGYNQNIRKKKSKSKDFEKLEEVGKRIRDIRKKMYFSLEELAEELGTKPITIDAWECGRIIPKGQAFQKFLEFSGATREYVIDGKGEWIDEIQVMMKELHKESE